MIENFDFFEFLSRVLGSPLTAIFCIVMFGIFVFAVIAKIRSLFPKSKTYKHGSAFAFSAPNVLVSVGVLGTFTGILVGLVDFDVSNIDASVPKLLDGLKIAFVTSVAGLTFSIAFRIFDLILPHHPELDDPENYDPRELLTKILGENEKQTKVLAGEEDGSLLTQLQKLRTTSQDAASAQLKATQEASEQQLKAFEEFSKTLAENNSKALLEALKEVIRDFNDKLTEQFGENFKELNTAVGRLLEWQDRFKEHVEKTEERIAAATAALTDTKTALEGIMQSLTPMPEMSGKLEEAVSKTNEQILVLIGLNASLAEMQDKAIKAFPEIDRSLTDLHEKFSAKATESADKLSQNAENFGKAVQENFTKFDEQMQQELSRVIGNMGNQLASISEKLAADYGKVADAIGRLQ